MQKRWLRGRSRETVTLLTLFAAAIVIFYLIQVDKLWVEPLFIAFYFLALGVGHSWQSVRFLFPFTLPFILLSLLSFVFIPLIGESLYYLLSFGLLGLILLLFPPLLQRLWRCQPLPNSELKMRLSHICEKYRFRHGGLLIWSVIKFSPTAAIW